MTYKSLLTIALLALTGSAHASLQEKLSAKCDEINTAKQDARAGNVFASPPCNKCASCGR